MSSAKSALESDTRVSVYWDCIVGNTLKSLSLKQLSLQCFLVFQVLAFEAGRRHKIRVNTISAGKPICYCFTVLHIKLHF